MKHSALSVVKWRIALTCITSAMLLLILGCKTPKNVRFTDDFKSWSEYKGKGVIEDYDSQRKKIIHSKTNH